MPGVRFGKRKNSRIFAEPPQLLVLRPLWDMSLFKEKTSAYFVLFVLRSGRRIHWRHLLYKSCNILSLPNAGGGLEYLRAPADAPPPPLLGPEERGRGPAAA